MRQRMQRSEQLIVKLEITSKLARHWSERSNLMPATCAQITSGLVYAKLGEKEEAKKMFARADELRQQHRSNESVILKLIEPPQQ